MSLQPKNAVPSIRLNSRIADYSAPLVDTVFPATELNVREAVSLTMKVLADLALAPDFQFTFEIVLAELLNNIVEHGFPDRDPGDIQLQVTVINDMVQIDTIDGGIQLPGLEAPDPPEPDLDVPRDDLPEGQFGWFMIRRLCEDLRYQRRGDENLFCLKVAQ